MSTPHNENSPTEPRITEVTRRALLRRSALLGGIAFVPSLVTACGSDDSTAFSTDSTTTSTAAASTTTLAGSSDTTANTGSDTTTTTAAKSGGGAFPTGGELAVDFTFSAGGGGFGPVRNPYIATWIEDTDGNLVQILSVWYLQDDKGMRYINHLQEFYALGGFDSGASVSGATRAAGDYTVTWNGSTLDGATATQGDFVINIEAAREHGQYELISEPFTIGTEGFSNKLTGQGELTAASLKFTV